VQPVPKAVYRSDFRENTNFCPQRKSNLGPLAQQASVLPLDHCDLQDPVSIKFAVGWPLVNFVMYGKVERTKY